MTDTKTTTIDITPTPQGTMRLWAHLLRMAFEMNDANRVITLVDLRDDFRTNADRILADDTTHVVDMPGTTEHDTWALLASTADLIDTYVHDKALPGKTNLVTKTDVLFQAVLMDKLAERLPNKR